MDKNRFAKNVFVLQEPSALPVATRTVFFEARKSCNFIAS
ncbi:MAG: hypothetical protein ACJAYJ_003208 [Saprospiraceae bacterium]|jgi:hypothetical protein